MKTANALEFPSKPKIGMISLGCAKNLVDAEIMLGSVLQRGMEITSRPEDAVVLVINTCAFINSPTRQRRGARDKIDQPGHPVLRNGFVAAESRYASAG